MKRNSISFEKLDNGNTICRLRFDGQVFIGEAKLHPADKDFESEKTGCFIAECKANIKKLKYVKTKLIREVTFLKKTYNLLREIEHYDSKALKEQIEENENQIKEIESAISDEKIYLYRYIQEKDAFYKRMRAKRTN